MERFTDLFDRFDFFEGRATDHAIAPDPPAGKGLEAVLGLAPPLADEAALFDDVQRARRKCATVDRPTLVALGATIGDDTLTPQGLRG